MKIGLIVLSIGDFGKKGYYNLQEIGLAKALDKLCEEVKVYKLVSRDARCLTEKIDDTNNTTITYLPSKHIGTNGIPNVDLLDDTLDMYICFSDTQLMFPRFYRWAKKNSIILIPYIGVLESHNTNMLKRMLMNCLCQRNIRIYRKQRCLAKTPYICEKLHNKGVNSVSVIPVGLDTQLLQQYDSICDRNDLRQKLGYTKDDKIVLFVGRMIKEKNPIEMIDVFSTLFDKSQDYRLIMIGNGELADSVKGEIHKRKLEQYVKIVDRIPNSEMWKMYTLADCFVNLNRQEIFGMAILEAMYYGCKVVAIEAPGPSYIIESGISGYLVKNTAEIIAAIEGKTLDKKAIQNRIMQKFLWRVSAEEIIRIINDKE